MAHLAIFVVDGFGFGKQIREKFRSRILLLAHPASGLIHPIESPKQIHGGRATCCQMLRNLGKSLSERFGHRLLQSDDHPIRRRNSYRRRPADAEHLDGFPNGFNVSALKCHQLGRQLRLVDQLQVAVGIPDPPKGFNVLRHEKVVLSWRCQSTKP